MFTRFLRMLFRALGKDVYSQDGLVSVHNHEFMRDPKFLEAYARGVAAAGTDYLFHWRVHVALWAATHASRIPGDFVECGVNRGFISSAIMQWLNWNNLEKSYYLLDTFQGLDERYLSKEEMASGRADVNKESLKIGYYVSGVETVKANFSEWNNVHIVQGVIPETLSRVKSERIAFLHIDLNCSPPEVEAMNYFWDILSPGAIVLFDDYAYFGFEISKQGMDKFGREKGVSILSLPTGQGLLIKPT